MNVNLATEARFYCTHLKWITILVNNIICHFIQFSTHSLGVWVGFDRSDAKFFDFIRRICLYQSE